MPAAYHLLQLHTTHHHDAHKKTSAQIPLSYISYTHAHTRARARADRYTTIQASMHLGGVWRRGVTRGEKGGGGVC